MKIRFFAGIDELRSPKDNKFKGRVINLDELKPQKVSLIAEDGFFYLSIQCDNTAKDCEYKLSEYESALNLFLTVSDYIERKKREADSEDNAEVMAAVFY